MSKSNRKIVEAIGESGDTEHTLVITASTAKMALKKALAYFHDWGAESGFDFQLVVYGTGANAAGDVLFAEGRELEQNVRFIGTDNMCRTATCSGDPNDGDAYDGYCGNCADRIAAGRP